MCSAIPFSFLTTIISKSVFVKWLVLLQVLICFLVSGCHTTIYAPGAVGKVVDADTGKPIVGAKLIREASMVRFWKTIPVTSVSADKKGNVSLPPVSETHIRFMYIPNPESLTFGFIISANGYNTNEVKGTTNASERWRVKLKTIELKKLPSK